MKRALSVGLLVAGLGAADAHAQPLPPAPLDWRLFHVVDWPNANSFTIVKDTDTLYVGGWAFECRSGLQPSTQRVGDIAVMFKRTNDGVELRPDKITVVYGARPDVAKHFAFACPAVGQMVGYTIIASGLPPAGSYTMHVLVDTFDGAGRFLLNIQKVPIWIAFTGERH